MGKMMYSLNEGNAWNPLKKWPRNSDCFCGSEKKTKKCCGPKVKEWCTKKQAKEFKDLIERVHGS